MARQYSPKAFFRHVPNAMLKRYFDARGVLREHDFSVLTESEIEPIYQAWLTIPDEMRGNMEWDFKTIDKLACDEGIKAMLEIAAFSEAHLAETLSAQKGLQAQAFWLFLERPQYWSEARAYYRADTIKDTQWNECRTVNHVPARVEESDIQALAHTLSQYFYTKEGRGKNCKVDYYRRGERDYFFAYPEDYAQSTMEYEGTDFKPLVRHPAFEIIFVYSQADSKISLFMKARKEQKHAARALFADVMLGLQLGEFSEEKRVYDLAPLKKADEIQFKYVPDSGIQSVAIKKLKFAINGTSERITLEVNPAKNPNAIYELRDKLCQGIPLSDMTVTQVGIVAYITDPKTGKTSPRSFDVNYPNTCSLSHDDRDEIIRKMLVDSGIEPR